MKKKKMFFGQRRKVKGYQTNTSKNELYINNLFDHFYFKFVFVKEEHFLIYFPQKKQKQNRPFQTSKCKWSWNN